MDWNINSSITGVHWPALPEPSGAFRLAALFQLEQSQWWSEDRLRQQQFSQIEPLLNHCIRYVPFYKDRLKNLSLSEPLTEEKWLSIPLLTRDEVQKNTELLRAEAIPEQHGKVTRQFTSGSTGKPVEVLGTDITAFFWNVFTLRDHMWHAHCLDGKLAVIRRTSNEAAKPPLGLHSANWGRATQGVIKTGPSSMLSIFTPISEQVEWLIREQPNHLLTNPSVLQDLALYCQREGVELPSLHEVRTISEVLPDGLRELCKEVWGAKLIDVYSSLELGYLAIQCPEHEHYHIQSEGVLVEILDENGRYCSQGEIGRVVVTSLHNYATPLIRYELGDYAEVGEGCDCGRGLPVIKRILGRYRGMLTLPSGERCCPNMGISMLNVIAPIKQFQVVQHTLDDIEVKVVLPRPIRAQEKDGLTRLFHETLNHTFNVTILQVDSIPRSAGGKYEEFMSKL
jgi:phenylacetate-CoA ligase